MSNLPESALKSVCTNCGASFVCGAAAGLVVLLVHARTSACPRAGGHRRLLLSGLPGAAPQRSASRSGNMRIASRLLHEKHFAAASRHGSQP
jgi:hypothetical protein